MSSFFLNKRYTAFVKTWDLSRIFNSLDDGDGMLSIDDVQSLLEKLRIQHISHDNTKLAMGSSDHMNFDEFCSGYLNLGEEGAHEQAETEHTYVFFFLNLTLRTFMSL